MREGHPRRARVRKRGEFRRIQSQGRKVHTKHFIVLVHPSLMETGDTRVGITVTKKIGNAVERNRTKRVLREVFRRNRDLFPPASDIVVIAKRGAPRLGFEDVLREFRGVAKNLARKASPKSPERGARRTVEVGEKPAKRRK